MSCFQLQNMATINHDRDSDKDVIKTRHNATKSLTTFENMLKCMSCFYHILIRLG